MQRRLSEPGLRAAAVGEDGHAVAVERVEARAAGGLALQQLQEGWPEGPEQAAVALLKLLPRQRLRPEQLRQHLHSTRDQALPFCDKTMLSMTATHLHVAAMSLHLLVKGRHCDDMQHHGAQPLSTSPCL